MRAPANPWIVFRKPRKQPRLRLFCFPFAGGGASIYRTWQDLFPEEIEICPVQPPGRENRLSDQRFVRIDALAEAVCEAIGPLLDVPFAFFGHSLGSAVAFEVALKLRDRTGREPVYLIASARQAPHLPLDDVPRYNLPEEEFKAKIIELEGTPKEVLEHPELMELMLPLLRADFEQNDTYLAPPDDQPSLECPVTVFGGLEDTSVTRERLERWEEISRGKFRLRMFAGGHFYLFEHSQALIAAITQELMPRISAR